VHPAQRAAWIAAELTQCAQPFGVLIAANEDMPIEFVALAARVLAELLDLGMEWGLR